MKIIAINGSPRKKWNTATLLGRAMEGVSSKGAETELVHLYDLNFKGCISCFACKLTGGKSYGKCVVKDDLSPLLEKLAVADGIILGSPIYLGNVTGEMRSFLERLIFQYLVYDATYSSIAPKKMKTGFIYTMNVDTDRMKQFSYEQNLIAMENAMSRTFGHNEVMYSNDTWQFDDYSKYETGAFSVEHKAEVRKIQFPLDCQKAFDMGVRFATESL
ncbi:MAG: flavodoxin family protein [Candidatus Eremiobacterota bacterium]